MEQSLENFLSSVDRSKFDENPFIQKTEKPWGYEILFTPPGLPYTGKVIHVNEGKRLSLQVHDQKVESWYLLSGQAKMIREGSNAELSEEVLQPGVGYTNNVGQRHRLIGITDCDILEVSTPEVGTTFRLEDDFERPSETDEVRNLPNRGWNPPNR